MTCPPSALRPARTVAGCFKLRRRRIGIDIALEALRECSYERRCASKELMAAARTCWVTDIVGPGLYAIGASA